MAEHYTKASFAFAAARRDAEFLEAILEAIEDLSLDLDAAPALAELSACFGERFAAAFPLIAVDGQTEVDPLSGLRGLFDDPEFPLLGLDGTTFVPRDDVTVEVMLWGGQIECDALAELIRRCCPETLAIAPVAFQAAFDCSRPRTDAYGGAAYVIFADRGRIVATICAERIAALEEVAQAVEWGDGRHIRNPQDIVRISRRIDLSEELANILAKEIGHDRCYRSRSQDKSLEADRRGDRRRRGRHCAR